MRSSVTDLYLVSIPKREKHCKLFYLKGTVAK